MTVEDWNKRIEKTAAELIKLGNDIGVTFSENKAMLKDEVRFSEEEEKHVKEIMDANPSHYERNGIDVIGFAEMQFAPEELKGFCRINILKYVTRYDRKGGIEDLRKAETYIRKLIELEDSK